MKNKYRKKTADWWDGRRVVLKRSQQTMTMIVPAGTTLVVEWKSREAETLDLVSAKPCSCCGVKIRLGGVSIDDLKWAKGEPT